MAYINKNIDKLTDEEINTWLLGDSDEQENSWSFMTKVNNLDENNASGWITGIYKSKLNQSLTSYLSYKLRPVITIKK